MQGINAVQVEPDWMPQDDFGLLSHRIEHRDKTVHSKYEIEVIPSGRDHLRPLECK